MEGISFTAYVSNKKSAITSKSKLKQLDYEEADE